jgi:hypothetical protein
MASVEERLEELERWSKVMMKLILVLAEQVKDLRPGLSEEADELLRTVEREIDMS